jgi:uncharacterized protein YndB with AHSA1/START domain
MTTARHTFDPDLDLVLERVVDVPPDRIFAGWTQPALLTQWFTPKPWETVAAEVELWPGGKFHTVMRSPEGEEFPNTGCVLEVLPDRKFAWTGALGPGYRPRPEQVMSTVPFVMSAEIWLERHGSGSTRYVATAIHGDAESRRKHEEMGFHAGWGAALDQLVALIRRSR